MYIRSGFNHVRVQKDVTMSLSLADVQRPSVESPMDARRKKRYDIMQRIGHGPSPDVKYST
jgi:hypothetical protein